MNVKITIPCPFCNGETTFIIPTEEYDAYKKSGDTTVFTTLSDDQIETLSTGTCDKCIGCCDSDDCNCVDLSNSKNVNNWEDNAEDDEDEDDNIYSESSKPNYSDPLYQKFTNWKYKGDFVMFVENILEQTRRNYKVVQSVVRSYEDLIYVEKNHDDNEIYSTFAKVTAVNGKTCYLYFSTRSDYSPDENGKLPIMMRVIPDKSQKMCQDSSAYGTCYSIEDVEKKLNFAFGLRKEFKF
jgi:hypothetical protein